MEEFRKTLGENHPGVEVLDEREIGTLFTLQKRGWTIKEMARELGWSRNTIRLWLRRGPEGKRPAMVFGLTLFQSVSPDFACEPLASLELIQPMVVSPARGQRPQRRP
jgi:hypothetical protein